MQDQIDPERHPAAITHRRLPVIFGCLVFGFGMAAGFLLAFSRYSLEDSAALIVSVILGVICFVLLAGGVIVAFRRPLMRRLFGMAESHLEQFAGPLTRVAEGAAARDPGRATNAARELLQLAFARYAWISTRRWIIASLTGLIAAMAALAGTALLFKQNQLIEAQSVLLQEQTGLLAQQNTRIGEQTTLLETQTELAEAARNAELAVEITNIAALLGTAMDKAIAENPGLDGGAAALVPVLDPVDDLTHSLRMRIISASQAMRPYRFLAQPLNAYDTHDKLRVASLRRQDDLPLFYDSVKQAIRWTEPQPGTTLIDRPASPERGQLLQVMLQSGIRAFEPFNFFGFDLSHADAQDMKVLGATMQGSQLSYARFDRSHILQGDFGGAALENASFRKTWIEASTFRPFDAETARGPYAADNAYGPTFLSGANFSGAFLRDTELAGAQMLTANFDAATLVGVSLKGASLGGATFRDAVLIEADFTGADLRSVDFDGAFVTHGDFLGHLADVAAPDTFRRDRYDITVSTPGEVLTIDSAYQVLAPDEVPDVWRIERVKPFEDDAPAQ